MSTRNSPRKNMPDIVLTTFNARYSHTAVGLRFLKANLGRLQDRCVIREFVLSQHPVEVAESILSESPRIVGVGVYIWNAVQSLELVSLLKRIRPDLTIVVGGPEVSHEIDAQEICALADYVIAGEADLAFAALAESLLHGTPPIEKTVFATQPDLSQVCLPYDLYDDDDVAHRVIYVETSRGCPYRCEFCLSALDGRVRKVDLYAFFDAMDRLYERGVRRFKLLDRTFNLDMDRCIEILTFFLDRSTDGIFVHVEMVPGRFPKELRDVVARFAPGSLQFEVGIQTFNPDVAARIQRQLDISAVEDNLQFLRDQTGVHVHADLIAGLPGEDVESFARGFDRLVALESQEIQVGILKRLRGAPIGRHDSEWAMVYAPRPPYEVLRTGAMSFETLQRLRHFSRFWDRIVNRGHFIGTCPLIWRDGSPFESFMALSDWLRERTGASCGIALRRLADLLFEYLIDVKGLDPEEVAPVMAADYRAKGRRDLPPRQARHLGKA